MITNRIHEVHGSELTAFRHCRLQHKWSFEDGYSLPVKAAPLEFGAAYHTGMEVFWNPDTWHLSNKELYILARDAFVTECTRQRDEYLSRIEQYELDPELASDYDSRIDLGKGMLRKFIRTLDRKQYTPVAVEEEVFVPVLGPTDNRIYCKCDDCKRKIVQFMDRDEGARTMFYGLPVYYAIRVDAMLQDRDGGYWIVDWKTAAQLLKDQIILELDGQVGSYCWALMEATGLDIRGFKYVQIRKDYPKLPRLLQIPRSGRWYSTNKQQLTDFQTFIQYVARHDRGAYESGDYDEYLTWLKTEGPDFVRWFTVRKTPTQLETIGSDIALQVMDLVEPHRVYPSSSRIQCQMCAFQEPCLERQSGGDVQDILDTQYVKGPPYYIVQREKRKS